MNVFIIFAHEWEKGSIMGVESTLEKALDCVQKQLVETDFKDYQPLTTNNTTRFVLNNRELGVWIEKWEVGNTVLDVKVGTFTFLVNKYGDEIDIEP